MMLVFAAAAALLSAAPPYPNPDWHEARSPAAETYHRWLSEHAGQHWASVVIQGGRLIYGGHGPRSYLRQKNDCGSIVKSLQSTILGTALLQGRLKGLDEKALPHWKNLFQTLHENDRGVTFRELAQYRDRWNDPAPPGSYRYNNSSATAAGECIAGLFGARRLADAAREHVMKPIGADWDLWHWSAEFSNNAGNPGPRLVLDASVYELAKLGYLWLRRGIWEGKRIFSEDFYREAVTDWSPSENTSEFGRVGHYGFWWFVNSGRFWLPTMPEDTFYHIGNGDPKRATCLLIAPKLDLVAVLSMTRLSDEGKWDVIQNSRVPSNEGPRAWAAALADLRSAAEP